MDAASLGGLYVIFMVFLVILAIVWTLLPFAIFGTKPILKSLLHEQQQTNQLLKQLAQQRVEVATARSHEPVLKQ